MPAPTTSQQAYNNLAAFQQSRRKPQDILREREQSLGVPTATQRQTGLRAAIGNTENLIRNVDPSVSGRTQGSLVTEAQKQRLINIEREPLGEQFREQSRALEGETANLSELNRRAVQEAQLATASDDAELNSLQGVYQMLYQKEKDEEERRWREHQQYLENEKFAQQLREQQRQFNAQASANSGLGGLLGGGGSSTQQADLTKQRAQATVTQLLGTNNPSLIRKTYDAIKKSAGYGNAYDRMKLQLIEQLYPAIRNAGGNIPLGSSQPLVVANFRR